MTSNSEKFNDAVAELRDQGLQVMVHSAANDTWYIKGDGIYIGYIATGAELLELKSADNLNILGVKSLG
jgi:hypothetical protein